MPTEHSLGSHSLSSTCFDAVPFRSVTSAFAAPASSLVTAYIALIRIRTVDRRSLVDAKIGAMDYAALVSIGLRALLRTKIRSLLTVLGITIGIGIV